MGANASGARLRQTVKNLIQSPFVSAKWRARSRVGASKYWRPMSQALCWIARGRGATANSKYSTRCRLSCWSNISRESTSSGRSLRKCAPWSNIRASISLRILRRLELFDVILCRNVLIYFDQDTKSDVLRRLAEALSSDGYLVLGAAET